MRRAFTLMELVVALGILALVMSFAGVIFRVSLDSHRLALANAEIMQKLRVITEQLDADFRSLRKDAEIFVVWGAQRNPAYTGTDPNSILRYERFDRIMFFTSGDFQTFGPNPRRGNVARVCYTLARGPSLNPAEPNWPQMQKPRNRILARTQHILVPPGTDNATRPLDTSRFTTAQWLAWNSEQEVDYISLEGWKRIPFAEKANMLSVIGDVTVQQVGSSGSVGSTTQQAARGVLIDRSNPASIHTLFCEGVGQFMVQGWYDHPRHPRWIPEIDPNENGRLDDDSDFILEGDGSDVDTENDPGVWYPRGGVTLRNVTYPAAEIDEEHFNAIPGLGRALKFTFTLYDSRNLIQKGRTFTHIVYLDN